MEKNTLTALLSVFLVVTVCVGPASAQHSLYQDIKANEIGDVITVVLRENISGSSTSGAETASNAGGSAGGSVSGNFLPFEPTFGSDVEVNYDSDESAQTRQGQLLEGYISVKIVDLNPQGDFLIEGNRVTEINGELQEMTLTGTVRPTDINTRNEVFSFRVANAQISYKKKGGVRGLTKERGFIKRAVLTGIGIALGAVVITRAVN